MLRLEWLFDNKASLLTKWRVAFRIDSAFKAFLPRVMVPVILSEFGSFRIGAPLRVRLRFRIEFCTEFE